MLVTRWIGNVFIVYFRNELTAADRLGQPGTVTMGPGHPAQELMSS